jgi:hypothetical protein
MLNLLNTIHGILNSIIPLLVTLGVVYFVWGVVQYVIADAEEAKKTGKNRIIYGIIGLAVIVSLWGLVNILVTTFDLDKAAPKVNNLVSTCAAADVGKIQGLFCAITNFIGNSIIPLLFALAVAMFVWGVINFFFLGVGEEAKRSEGKQFIIWGIVALAVMLSIWGLVRLLGGGISNTSILPGVTPNNSKPTYTEPLGTGGSSSPACGNFVCESGETADSCATDCTGGGETGSGGGGGGMNTNDPCPYFTLCNPDPRP